MKSSVIPSMVYDWARRGDRLAQSLTRMIPKPLNFLPIERNGYFVTICEDVNSRIVSYTPQDLRILEPELQRREVDPRIIARLYTTALYHEVLTEISQDFPDESLSVEVLPTNYSREFLVERFARRFSEFKDLFERSVGRGYEEKVQKLLQYQLRNTTLGTYDNKPDNYVGPCFVDFGISKQGDEIDDLARLVLGEEEFVKNPVLFSNYVDTYVRIRQRIQQQYRREVTYAPTQNLKQLVREQLEMDTWRMMGWSIKRESEKELIKYARCAQGFDEV